MIDNGNLPLHGACVSLTLKNGSTKNVVIIGDSGAGKSESLEALSEYAGEQISSQLTVLMTWEPLSSLTERSLHMEQKLEPLSD